MKQTLYKTTAFIAFTAMAFPAFADGSVMPGYAYLGLALLIAVIGLSIAFALTKIFRPLLEKLRGERKKHIWWMLLLTFATPALYMYLEDSHHLLYDVESAYGYDIKHTVHSVLIIVSVVVGFIIGYYITPKEEQQA